MYHLQLVTRNGNIEASQVDKINPNLINFQFPPHFKKVSVSNSKMKFKNNQIVQNGLRHLGTSGCFLNYHEGDSHTEKVLIDNPHKGCVK